MSEVYLHIGPPKTGSGYVRKAAWNRREDLAERGLLYPADHEHEFIWAANELQGGRFIPVAITGGGKVWEKMSAKARSWPGQVLISSELFAFCEPDQIQRIADSLAPSVLRLIVMGRCRADLLPALYQQKVKMVTADQSWEKFLSDSGESQESWPQAPGVLVERWVPYVGRERVHVVTVPRRMTDPQVLLHRFADVLGIDPAHLRASEDKANIPLDATDVALVRAVSARTVGRLDRRAQQDLINNRLVPLLRELDRPVRPLRLPASLRPSMMKVGTDDVAALTAAGCHIHGDLDDLRPDDEAFDTVGTVDGAMAPAEVLAVAVDALVAAVSRATSGIA
jgi:hypothetical protein